MSVAHIGVAARYRLGVIGQRLTRPVLKSLPDGVRKALSRLRLEIRIQRIVKKSRREFYRWRDRENLKLNLGCGGDLKPGWINVDLALESLPMVNAETAPTFINYDLRRQIPLNENSCELIYSSHFFEHLEYSDSLRLLRQCYHLLKPDGIFRISLPDFKGACTAYLKDDYSYFELVDPDTFLSEVAPETLTLVDYVNFAIYQSGEHKRVYDEEKVIRLLQSIGFTSVSVSSYETEIDPASPLRLNYSFYVQAKK
jgi:predicted SAM-dependent methyltransferase